MSLNRATVDLSAALTADTPTRVQVNNPFWLRFHEVPSSIYIRLGSKSADRIPVSSPFTIKFCGDTVRDIFVDNDGVAGSTDELVILYGDAETELDDFLASAASTTEWEPHAIVVPAADNTLRNLLAQDLADATQAGTTANAAYAIIVGTERRVYRIGIAASAADGYTIRESHNMVPYLDVLFNPNSAGIVTLSKMPSFRFEVDVQGDIVYTAGELMLAVGYINRVAGVEAFGVGFFVSRAVNGNDRWYAGVLDYSGGAVGNKPLVADRIIWQDTGISAIDTVHTLALEIGVIGETPYLRWEIDGVTVYEHTGTWPAWAPTWNVSLGFGLKAQHATLADTAFLYMVMYRLMHKLQS